MKLVHLSDLHLVPPGERLWGLDPVARLEACLRDIARYHSDADFCVISGDLTERGDAEAYMALKSRLERFPLKTFLMLGNHDDRDTYFEVFDDAPKDDKGFAQEMHLTSDAAFLFLDTLEPGQSSGSYCKARCTWLERMLDRAGDVPIYIFIHHPPFDIGIPFLDRVKLADHEAIARITADRTIHHLFFGHVHRPVFCTWQGILCSAVPGLAHQVPLVAETVSTQYSIEPPIYAVVTVDADRTLVHYDAFLHRHSADMPLNHG